MFGTISHTFELMRASWRVLMHDRELLVFPLLAALGLLGVLAFFFGLAGSLGTLGRVSGGAGAQEPGALDAVVGILLYVASTFVVVFFNAALVSAALERLRGADPTVRSGLRAAWSHLPAILGWTLIAATVGLILRALRDRTDNIIGQIVVSLAGAAWAYATFFVIPVLVAEGLGPIASVKRSGSLFRETWGRQVAANFGFGLIYIGTVLVAGLPAYLLFTIEPIAGIAVGVLLGAIAIGTVQALEGIFKAALYEFAIGESPREFAYTDLASVYRAL